MQQNIDQLFKDGLQAHGTPPPGDQRDPEQNWQRIESMLDTQPKRRAAWLWLSAAATIALLVLLGWAFQPSRHPMEPTAPLAMNGTPNPSNLPIESHLPPPAPPVDQPVNLEPIEPTNETSQQSQSQLIANQPMQPVVNGVFQQGLGTLSGQAVSGGTMATFKNSPTANGTYTYSWANNQDQSNRRVVRGGNYKIVVTDAVGCVAQNKSTLTLDETGNFFLPRSGFLRADSTTGGFDEPYAGEGYAETVENPYFQATVEPLSTFSIDVDRASYANHRRFIESGSMPPKYSVRVEEFINYFDYEYQPPLDGKPFNILPEVATCPWSPTHKLVRIALKGREVPNDKVPPSNIVFLLDVSGSMDSPDKLGLLKKAMGMLTEQLREQDRVSIVVYAGAAGLVLPPTSGVYKQKIMSALDELQAGGSTAGGEGIELAYATARQNFFKGGNNRVILATDGDFNVGISDEKGLERLIEKKREEGVFLSVLGFGEGNLQDAKMELLADKGNGNYNYIDSDREAQKVLVNEFGGTLYTIAKDVKVQVEFNPARVASYRLVGYENRKLKNEDFANDRIDAGELGAGHTVTALYEVIPVGSGTSSTDSEPLKYSQRVWTNNAATEGELLTVKLRYKDPDGSVSKLLSVPLVDNGRNIAQTSDDFRWASAVAAYGLILRQSEFKSMASYEMVLALARSAMGRDKEGLRREFITLVEKAAAMQQTARKD